MKVTINEIKNVGETIYQISYYNDDGEQQVLHFKEYETALKNKKIIVDWFEE